MIKILITGGSGFIGTNLLDFYCKDDIQLLNIDFHEPKKESHFKYWRNVDINDYNRLEVEIKQFDPDYVIHLAARTDLNGKKMSDYITNYRGSQNLIDILNKTITVKRVIFTSTMLVCKPGYIPKDFTDYATSTIYGESKVLMERNIRESIHNYEWAIVRPTSIWGPYFGIPYRNFFDMIMKKMYFHIGDTSYTKTYGYIGNIVYQINSILNAPKSEIQEQVFYLGDYEPTNIHKWADEIASELRIKIFMVPLFFLRFVALLGDILKMVGINFPMTSFRLKNMTTNNNVDLSNTKCLAPNLPFSRIEGIKSTIEWLKK